jgi:DNA helicase HerA-like ATPase
LANPGQARHICVYGATGTGKSTLVKRLISKTPRLLIIDPQEEYSGTAVDLSRSNWRNKALEVIEGGYSKGRWRFQIAFRNAPSWPLAGHEIWGLLKSLQAQYRKGKGARVVIVLEEADQVAPLNALPTSANGIQVDLPNRGRHYGVDYLAVTQRPAQLYPNVRSQAASQVFFRLGELNAQNYAGNQLGADRSKLRRQSARR